jgi:hypothetical protein
MFFFELPVNPETVTEERIISAVCPNPDCYRVYKPEYRNGCGSVAGYPKACSNKPFPTAPACGTILTRPVKIMGVEVQIPVKPFTFVEFGRWAAGLASHPAYEYQDAGRDLVETNDIFSSNNFISGNT